MTDELFADVPRVVSTETSLAGSTDRLERPLRYGERLVLVVDVTVAGVGVKSSGDGPRAKRELKVLDVWELHGDMATGTIAALRAQRRAAEDNAAGRAPLPGLELTETADGLVTPSEAAALGDTAGAPAEPWDGYDDLDINGVVEGLENTEAAAGPTSVGFRALLERTRAYETAGKARKGILKALERKLKASVPPPTEPDEATTPALPGEPGDGLTVEDEPAGADVFETPADEEDKDQ